MRFMKEYKCSELEKTQRTIHEKNSTALQVYTFLELVVVGVQRRDIGLETLACTNVPDKLLNLAALVEGSCQEVSESYMMKDVNGLHPFINSQWSNTDCGKA